MSAPPNISFNLVDQPWIPVIDLQGHPREISLHEALTLAHTLRALAGATPVETAALYRLLLAVLHSALRGPSSWGEWHTLWEAGSWDTDWLNRYLQQWYERFDLFHPVYPFYQVAIEDKPTTALMMRHGMATGDTLFDHRPFYEGVQFTPAQAARALLIGQTYGLGGARDPSRNMYLSGSPWLQGIIFLLQGKNLFETLGLNLIRYGDGNPMYIFEDDAPYWEKDDPFEPERSLPRGYLDYITWPSRRARLLPQVEDGKITVTQVYLIPGLSLRGELFDPLKQYRRIKTTGRFHRCFDLHRALWRDSHALMRLDADQETTPPRNIIWAAELVNKGYLDPSQTLQCMALGMLNDKARIEFYRQEQLSVPLAFLESQQHTTYVGALKRGAELAEDVADSLYWGVRTLAELFLSPSADRKDGRKPDSQDVKKLTAYWAADRLYWSRLEELYRYLLADIPAGPEVALETWQKALFRVAWESLNHASQMAGESPRALKASMRARGELNWRLSKLSTPEKEEMVT